jgi:acyl-homoserine-lactone acylase
VALPSADALLKGLGKDPSAPFGSNGTALGGDATVTGKGMVLGNPHFPGGGATASRSRS